jgi:hypothetical protein
MKGIDEGVVKVINYAEKLGYKTCRTTRNHLKFVKPGKPPVFFSGTPGDHRAWKNGISKLRRAAAR